MLYGQLKIAGAFNSTTLGFVGRQIKIADGDPPATWMDRGLLGGIAYGARDITDGHLLRGVGGIATSPIGAIKGSYNAVSTGFEDYQRALSQLGQGKGINALTNGAKGLYNHLIGPVHGALLGNGLLSRRQAERHNNPNLEEL